MKNLVKHSLYLFLFSCLFLSCDKEEELTPVATESVTATLNTGGAKPCPNCNDPIPLRKTVGQEETVGTVQVCQTKTNELTITFKINDNLNAWFSQTGVAIFEDEPNSLNPGDLDKESTQGSKPKTVVRVIDLTKYKFYYKTDKEIYIATGAVVSGPGGAGGQVWAGTYTPDKGNPNSRYFKFKLIKCEKPKECPKLPCLYPKEYWCKPVPEWPCKTIKVGYYEYSHEQIRAIYLTAGSSDAKEAFLQAATLLLNLKKYPKLKDDLYRISNPKDPCYNPKDPCYKVLKHLECILAYFKKHPTQVKPDNICNTKTFPDSKEIRYAYEKIRYCLKAHACKDDHK